MNRRKSLHAQQVMNVAQNVARKMGLDPKNARPAELVLAQLMNPSKSTYTFNLDNEVIVLPKVEKRLKDRNAFISNLMAIGILPAPIINTKEYSEAAAIQYFPDPNVFTGVATADLTEAQALESVYHGTYTIQTNQGVRVDAEKTLHFRTVHQTQASASTANMYDGSEMKDLGAFVRFGGGDNNKVIINIDCGDQSAIGGPATHNNYLIIRLRGSIIHGSTSKQYLGR